MIKNLNRELADGQVGYQFNDDLGTLLLAAGTSDKTNKGRFLTIEDLIGLFSDKTIQRLDSTEHIERNLEQIKNDVPTVDGLVMVAQAALMWRAPMTDFLFEGIHSSPVMKSLTSTLASTPSATSTQFTPSVQQTASVSVGSAANSQAIVEKASAGISSDFSEKTEESAGKKASVKDYPR